MRGFVDQARCLIKMCNASMSSLGSISDTTYPTFVSVLIPVTTLVPHLISLIALIDGDNAYHSCECTVANADYNLSGVRRDGRWHD